MGLKLTPSRFCTWCLPGSPSFRPMQCPLPKPQFTHSGQPMAPLGAEPETSYGECGAPYTPGTAGGAPGPQDPQLPQDKDWGCGWGAVTRTSSSGPRGVSWDLRLPIPTSSRAGSQFLSSAPFLPGCILPVFASQPFPPCLCISSSICFAPHFPPRGSPCGWFCLRVLLPTSVSSPAPGEQS